VILWLKYSMDLNTSERNHSNCIPKYSNDHLDGELVFLIYIVFGYQIYADAFHCNVNSQVQVRTVACI